jgi:hypothetical protein
MEEKIWNGVGFHGIILLFADTFRQVSASGLFLQEGGE